MEPTQKVAKSASISLKAHGSTMRLAAQRRADGTAVTFVATTDADKKTVRGMTETHADMETAKATLAGLATKAEKLGWVRGSVGGFRAKPDAFSTLPAAPKAKK
jgi:hypothetical protein